MLTSSIDWTRARDRWPVSSTMNWSSFSHSPSSPFFSFCFHFGYFSDPSSREAFRLRFFFSFFFKLYPLSPTHRSLSLSLFSFPYIVRWMCSCACLLCAASENVFIWVRIVPFFPYTIICISFVCLSDIIYVIFFSVCPCVWRVNKKKRN